jgi:hypothetical protein
MAFNEMKKAVKAAGGAGAAPDAATQPSAAGVVESIAYDQSHPGMARVGLRHAGPGKSKGKGNLGMDTDPRSSAHVHIENANKLKIGQRVHLRAEDGEYGAGTSDEFTQ